MGEAILRRGLQETKFNFFVCEKNYQLIGQLKKRYRIYKNFRIFSEIEKVLDSVQIIIIAVKPQDIQEVLEKISAFIKASKRNYLIISIAAGIKINYLEKRIFRTVRIIRVMPNINILIGKGVVVLKKSRYATSKDLEMTKKIFNGLGKVIQIKKESLMDAVTALSGSGPAYVAFIIDTILDAAAKLGLNRKLSTELIYYTFLGTLELLKNENFQTDKLILKVASKKGTTQKALEIFEKNKLSEIIAKGIFSAFQRAKELAHK